MDETDFYMYAVDARYTLHGDVAEMTESNILIIV